MTKKEMFAHIATINADNDEIVAFCEKEIAMLSRKRTSDNSKAKKETAARAEKVYNALAEMDKAVQVDELRSLTSDEEVASYTNQRVASLLRKLVKEERVINTKEKGKSFYAIA